MEEFRLLQEDYSYDPWRVLVVCILLNRTQRKTAESVIAEIFERWPTASAMADAMPHDVCEVVKVLGLRKRGIFLTRMSKEYLDATDGGSDTTDLDVVELSGCGKYAAEAWAMVVKGDLSFEPEDKELKRRWEMIRI